MSPTAVVRLESKSWVTPVFRDVLIKQYLKFVRPRTKKEFATCRCASKECQVNRTNAMVRCTGMETRHMSGKFKSPDKRNNRNHCSTTPVPVLCAVAHPSTDNQHAGEPTSMPKAMHQLDKCFLWKGRTITSNGT